MDNDDNDLLPMIEMTATDKILLKKRQKSKEIYGDVWPKNARHKEKSVWTSDMAQQAWNITKPKLVE